MWMENVCVALRDSIRVLQQICTQESENYTGLQSFLQETGNREIADHEF